MDLYLASSNAHKVGEFQALAALTNRGAAFGGNSEPSRGGVGVVAAARVFRGGEGGGGLQAGGLGVGEPLTVISAAAVGGMPAVVEDTGSFVGNARKKALALRERLPRGGWALADDSGLCVEALDGGPGVESAYFAGPEGDAAANLTKLVRVLREVPAERRGAEFVCVLVLAGPEGEERSVTGRCAGRLATEPRGGAGFGYDPLFVPDGWSMSFAELGEAVKHGISHRARAWHALVEALRSG
jgi:XTP/dITP diphosphohydrolase